jgi:hypothetical protein
MKNAVLSLLLSTTLLFTVACSKVKTVTVLAEQWDTGQHRTCMYGHEKLYCFKPDEIPSLQPPFTPYTVESHRAELVKDPRSDGGTYETQFVRRAPVDFGVWDCYKTGTGSPAVSCELKHQPTAEETAGFMKAEKEQQEHHHLEESAHKYMSQLSPSDLVHACGEGEQSGGALISTKALDFRDQSSIRYPFGEFKFTYLGKYNDATRQRCNEESPSCKASYFLDTAIRTTPSVKVWNLDMQIKYPEQPLEFVQPIPCMFGQVQLLNSQPPVNQPPTLGSDSKR